MLMLTLPAENNIVVAMKREDGTWATAVIEFIPGSKGHSKILISGDNEIRVLRTSLIVPSVKHLTPAEIHDYCTFNNEHINWENK